MTTIIKNTLMYNLALFLIVNLFACSNGSGNTSQDSNTNCSDSNSGSACDSGKMEEITDTNSVLITDTNSYQAKQIDIIAGYDEFLTHLDVDGSDMYVGLSTHIYKETLGDPTPISMATKRFYPLIRAPLYIVYEENNIYMLAMTNHVIHYNRQSDNFDLMKLPDDLIGNAGAFAADKERFYFTTTGCTRIVSFKRDGTDPIECTHQRTGDIGGYSSIALGENHVYCSGGGAGSTKGKIYRCAKTGGELEEFATLEMADHVLPFQAGAMRVLNNALYYLTADPRGAALFHQLSKVDELSKKQETLLTVTWIEGVSEGGGAGRKLLYDEKRNAFYWLRRNVSAIYKYDLNTNSSTYINIRDLAGDLAQPTLAHDDDYLYWPTKTTYGIYRMKKF